MKALPVLLVLLFAPPSCVAENELEAVIRKYLAIRTISEREEMAPELAAFDATPVQELTKAIWNVIPQPSGFGRIERRVMTNRGEFRYILELPDGYDPAHAYPVLLFMMGPTTQPEDAFLIWTPKKLLGKYIVAAPALPPDDPNFTGYPKYETADAAIEGIFNDLGRAARVDPSRVFVGGFSMGGAFTWSAAVLQGDRVAGAIPVSCDPPNNVNPEVLRNLRHVPLFITHGTLDQITNVRIARDAVKLLEGYGYPHVFHELPATGHVWPESLEPDILEWMEGKRRVLFPKEVTFHLLYWCRPMRRMYWLEGTKGKYYLDGVEGRSFAGATGKIEGNRIEVTSTLLEKVSIYLNDALVDFSKEVVVVVNGQERHRGLVKPSLKVALDGFRERWDPEDLYTAKLTLEGLWTPPK